MEDSKESLEKRILADIHTTGFVKELELARLLNVKKWRTRLNQTYLDKDIDTNREIDIIAAKKCPTNNDRLHVWVDLVIESKRSFNPWVILTNNFESSLGFHLNPGWTIIHGGEKYLDNGAIFPPRLLDEHFMRSKFSRIGSAFHESFKEPKETSKIFQAIMSASKASVHCSSIHGASPEVKDYKPSDATRVTFYHPIVVLDGPLYEVYLNDDNSLTLKEADWIPITYNYSSLKYSEFDGTVFHCDIVRSKFFEKYLDLVDTWVHGMGKELGEYHKQKYYTVT